MTSTIITALVGLFCTLASSMVTFLLTRRKYNEEVMSQKIDNLNKAFDLATKMNNETSRVLDEKIATQENIIKQLQDENIKLKKQVYDLQMKFAKMLTYTCNDANCQLRQSVFSFDTTSAPVEGTTEHK